MNRGLIDGTRRETNRYRGRCTHCGGDVPAGAGFIEYNFARERWDVFHAHVDQCHLVAARAPFGEVFIDTSTLSREEAVRYGSLNIPTIDDIKEQMKMQLFEYAVLYVPVDEKGNPVRKDMTVLVDITSKLAKDETSLRNHVLRDVTLADGQDVDNVEIVVRPFARI